MMSPAVLHPQINIFEVFCKAYSMPPNVRCRRAQALESHEENLCVSTKLRALQSYKPSLLVQYLNPLTEQKPATSLGIQCEYL